MIVAGPTPVYDADKNSTGSYALAIRAVREKCIRRGQIKPVTHEEHRWADEGPVEPKRLEAANG